MPERDSRATLADRQKQLVDALTHSGNAPEGFDAGQVATAADALLKKRIRTAQIAWPELHAALAECFDALFKAYARSHPLPREGERRDARQFMQFALNADNLTADQRLALRSLRRRDNRFRRALDWLRRWIVGASS